MNSYIYAAPCHFGLESVLKREIQGLGCKIVSVDDGRVTFEGDADTAAAANIKLRTAERILLLVDEFRAVTYDELFEKTKAVHWEEFLPRDAKFWVAKASSVKSALFSPSDIQRIIKKAMADRMSAHYGYRWAPETGAAYPLRVAIRKDIVTLGLDTTGTSLHKRGYRISPVIAPISETLAAALILLTPWRQGRILVDPFCGSGTFPIEAAMIAGNIAPGVNREFLSEKWDSILPEDSFRRAREQARAEEIPVTDTDIQGYDIDPKAVKAARIFRAMTSIRRRSKRRGRMQGRPACFRTFIFREGPWRISAIPASTDLSSRILLTESGSRTARICRSSTERSGKPIGSLTPGPCM